MSEDSKTGTSFTSMTSSPSIMVYFQYEHLRPELQTISKPFCELARWVVDEIQDSAERAVTLRKLLEAKDAAVRAAWQC